MLSPADEALARRDPAIPGLRVLLDPDAFADTLRGLFPGGGVRAVEPRYVRYKPGTSCLVGCRIQTEAGPLEAYARAHDPAIRAKLEKAGHRGQVPSVLGEGIGIDRKTGIVVFPFPNDHELEALAHLADAESRRRLVADVIPNGADAGPGRVEVLRYKPERRLVVRLDTADDARAVLRFHTAEDYERIGDNVTRFESGATLRVPARLGRSKRLCVAAYEWIEGTSLRDKLVRGDVGAGSCRAIGAAVAALHTQRSSRLSVATTAAEFARSIADAARAVGAVVPAVADRAARVAQRLAARFVERRWRMRRAVHGDLSADQVIIRDEEVAIVDFDRAGLGDPRIDLGTFQARLEYDALSGAIPTDVAGAALEAVLEGYRDASEKDATGRVPRFAAAALLLLAVEPFRMRLNEWPALTERVIGRAETLAGGGGDHA